MSIDNRRENLRLRLQAALEANEPANLVALLEMIHAADLAEFLPEFDDAEQQTVLDALSDEQAAELLDELEPEDRAKVLDLLSVERASDIIEEMPTDEAADLLGELPTEEADALLQHMEPESADDLADLLRYSEDTAGGLMAKEFVSVTPDDRVADVLAMLRQHQDDAEMIYYLYILDEDERLIGVVTLRKLIISDPTAMMSDIMAREFISVPVQMPQDEVAEIVRRHDLLAVPVLDRDGRMLGLITVDDIGDVVEEEASEDLLEMSGTEENDEAPRPILTMRSWRSGLYALGGGVASSILIWSFTHVSGAVRQIASFLPFLLILGITISSQAAVSMDRAYENAVERHQTGRIFRRELIAGGIIAILAALLAGVLVYMTGNRDATTTMAMIIPIGISLWVSSGVGASGVYFLRRHGGWLGTTSLTVIVAIAVLLSTALYLLLACC